MKESIFYINGEFVSGSDAKISVLDLGLTRGYAIFDAFRTYNRIPFRLEEHLARLDAGLKGLNIRKTEEIQKIESLLEELMARNPEGDLAFRITVTAGINEEINFYPKNPTLIIGVNPAPSFPKEYYEQGVFLITTKESRIFPSFKTTSYLGAGLAIQAAIAKNAQDAIYLTSDGKLLELTRSNLFAVKNGRLITPKEDILFGITRKVVIELALSLGMEVEEGPLYQKDLENWDEAFHTSSFKEIVPIVKIDDVIIGDGTVGPITKKVMAAFQSHTRQAIAMVP